MLAFFMAYDNVEIQIIHQEIWAAHDEGKEWVEGGISVTFEVGTKRLRRIGHRFKSLQSSY